VASDSAVSVVVVGAGIAGLACAHRLRTLGCAVRVLEAEPVAGGRMRSERLGEFVVDRGAQFIASGYHNLLALAAELGLTESVRPLTRSDNAILRDGALHAGDYDSLPAFLRSRLLSWGARARLPALLLDVWRHRRGLDPLHPERAARLDGEDLHSYLQRRVGEEAATWLVEPALSATFDSDPEDLSGAFALLALRFVLRGFRLLAFEGGTGRLSSSLAAGLDVRCSCAVRSVETDAGGARVRFLAEGKAEQELRADAVVVAVPGSLVAGLCPGLLPAERAFFAGVRFGRGAIVHLALARPPASLLGYGVAFPRPEGLDLYGLAVDHHKPGAAPPGRGLLNAALTAGAAARTGDASDADVVDLVVESLARTPVGRLQPIDAAVHRWDPMLPQFGAGYLSRLAAFLTRAERTPRLAFAGDYLIGPYTEAALTSGLRAAAEIRAITTSG
jgi:oxygen-dependent protoporphyrinogen oxidase